MVIAENCIESKYPPRSEYPFVEVEFGAGCKGRIEREEENGLCDFLRRPEALHRNDRAHLLPEMGSLAFIGV
jgi:hypothetical protein